MDMDAIMASMKTWIAIYGLRIPVAIIIFLAGRWIARRLSALSRKIMEKAQVDRDLSRFLANLAYYVLLLVVIVAALGHMGVNTASLLTLLGAAGLAVGLALKDSLSNFAAGVMLILFKPFKSGDYVDTAGVAGTVKRITIFNTELASPDNQKIIVPNSAIMGGTITNVTAMPTRRVDLVFGIGYSDDIDVARDIIMNILKADPRVLDDPAPVVAVSELADSSVNFVTRPWAKTEDYWAVYFAVTEAVKKTFDEKGISIPFPQTDIYVHQV